MRKYALAIGVMLALFFVAAPAHQAQQKGGQDETGDYNVVGGWPGPFAKPGYIQGAISGVFAETPNRIFVMNRGEIKLPEKLPNGFNGSWGSTGERAARPPYEPRNFILIFDGKGKLLESWTQYDHLFAETKGSKGPHTVKISPYDPERNVWIIDDTGHRLLKFTNDGKQLLMTIGEPGVPGNDEKHMNGPTDIAWLPDGTFFVTQGNEAAEKVAEPRIMKFDKNGKFLMQWGSKGKGPGQMDGAHGIAIDRNRRLYVADRYNGRIQIFDENGKFLDQWPGMKQPFHIVITPDQYLWLSDGESHRFFKYDLNGKLLYAFGYYGYFPGGLYGPHQFSVDTDGNLYIAEVFSGRAQKFTPKPGADKSKLITPPGPIPQSKSSN